MGVSTKRLSIFRFDGPALEKISEIESNESSTLLDLFNAHKISISQSCGGFASCTTCRIFVNKGVEKFPVRNELEAERAKERNFSVNERLACQVELSEIATDEIEVVIANPVEE